MDKYINLLTLSFHLSWMTALMWAQVVRGAYRHYIFMVEAATFCLLLYELYREVIIITWQVQTEPTPLRIWLYGVEHVLLGLVIREGLLYVERYKKARNRRCKIY